MKLEIQRKNGKIYCPLKENWYIETPEEKVRQEYIKILVEEFGYSLKQMAQEKVVNNSQRGQGKARADIVIWKSEEDKNANKAAFIIVECKAENVKIHEEDYYQGYNYASWAGANFFITTNEKETKYFAVDKEYLPKKLVEILNIPNADEVYDPNKIKEFLMRTKTFTREEFSKVLKACHNIIRNNDKLSPEAAFDEISKILFMKIKFERESSKNIKVFTKEEFIEAEKNYEKHIRPNLRGADKELSYMQLQFENTKDKFKDDYLFEQNETIKIRKNSFEQILEKLQTYNLSDTQDDVKGIAFEQFLGTTFRGELGQYFTPRTVVDFITNILDPKENEVICDPTCGSGGFLIKAFEYIREQIEIEIRKAKEDLRKIIEGDNYDKLTEKEQLYINQKIEKMQSILNKELDTQIKNSRMYNLSRNCIFGTDANPRMARTSKMNMIMHGDGHGGVHHHDGLLNVNGIFEERFDVILTNPPFGARVDKTQKITELDKIQDEKVLEKYLKKYGKQYEKAIAQINNNLNKPIIDLYDVGQMSTLTEVLFMERCLKLLKKGGRMGMVLPEGILNNANLQKVREYFEGKAKIIFICSIPQDVFIAAGATVKPSLVFFKRFTDKEEKEYKYIKFEAESEIKEKYQKELNKLEEQLENAKTKRAENTIRKKITEIEEMISEESKPIIKRKFDYEIPIAMVNDAGITSTGIKTDNKEFLQLETEFKEYNSFHKLWEIKAKKIIYKLKNNCIVKIFDNKEENLGEI